MFRGSDLMHYEPRQSAYEILGDRLGTGDLIWAILRGHIFIEALMRRSLTARVAKPEKLRQRGLKYAALSNWVVALGAVPEEYEPALNKLNALRNRIGHELDVRLEWEEIFALVDVLPTRWFEFLDKRYDGDEKLVHYVQDVVRILSWVLFFGEPIVAKALADKTLQALHNRLLKEAFLSKEDPIVS
jgi:hypothetical protein